MLASSVPEGEAGFDFCLRFIISQSEVSDVFGQGNSLSLYLSDTHTHTHTHTNTLGHQDLKKQSEQLTPSRLKGPAQVNPAITEVHYGYHEILCKA